MKKTIVTLFTLLVFVFLNANELLDEDFWKTATTLDETIRDVKESIRKLFFEAATTNIYKGEFVKAIDISLKEIRILSQDIEPYLIIYVTKIVTNHNLENEEINTFLQILESMNLNLNIKFDELIEFLNKTAKIYPKSKNEIYYFKKLIISSKNKDGQTPLQIALKNSNFEVIKLLIENGADVNARDDNGQIPLMYAAKHEKDPEIINFLIENGADVNAKDNDGLTPLIYAARYNENPEVVKILIDNGAFIDSKIFFYDNFWKIATVEYLKNLIDNTSDVNVRDNNGKTILMFAAENNTNAEVIKLLIENGSEVNAKNNYGYTALMYAAGYNNNPEIIKVLIDNGADVNAKDNDGKTPLMWAAKSNNLEMIKVLIDNGADKNAKDKNGWRPLMYASFDKFIHTIRYKLFTAGKVTIKIYNSRGQLVRTLIKDQFKSAETLHSIEWNGQNDNGKNVWSGVYYCVIETSSGEKAIGKFFVLR